MNISRKLTSVSLFIFVSVLMMQTAVYAGDKLKTVHATGIAVGTDASAEQNAILDAQRKAVIEAAGVFIDTQSLVNNYELIDDQILSRARGYVTDYKIISCKIDQDLTHCEIRATVGVENLKRDWQAALPQLIRRQSEPRCMVIITEDADTSDLVPPKLGGSCAHRMENLLQKNGFRLVDQRRIAEIMDKDTEAAFLRGDMKLLAAKAQQFDAELVIYGEALADPLGPYTLAGRTIYRWQTVLNARIIRSDTADVIASDSYEPKGPYMGASNRCGSKCFSDLAKEVTPKLLRDLTAQLQKRFQHRIFEVKFHGCSPKSFSQKVLPSLSRMPGVQAYNGIVIRSTAVEEIVTEVHWAGDLASLISSVYRVKISDGVEFNEQSRDGTRVLFDVIGLD